MIENHYRYTGSIVAKRILNNWNAVLPQFVKVYPSDYRRVLEEAAKIELEEEKSEAERKVDVSEGN